MKEVKVLIAEYIAQLKLKIGISNSTTLSEITNTAEGTLKNLCSSKTDNPGIATVAQVVYSLGGSLDEMFNHENNKEELQGISVLALKEIYEHQLTTMKEANELHIKNIRDHYERHISEIKEHYEKRLADKREHIDTIMLDKKWFRLASVFSVFALLGIFFFIEFMTPGHGWFTFK